MKKRFLLPIMGMVFAMSISLPAANVLAVDEPGAGTTDGDVLDGPASTEDEHFDGPSADPNADDSVAPPGTDNTTAVPDDAKTTDDKQEKTPVLDAGKKDELQKEEPKKEDSKKMPATSAAAAELLSLIAIGGASALGLRHKKQ